MSQIATTEPAIESSAARTSASEPIYTWRRFWRWLSVSWQHFFHGRMDARRPALVRILFSLLLLVYLAVLYPDLDTWYGVDGLVPAAGTVGEGAGCAASVAMHPSAPMRQAKPPGRFPGSSNFIVLVLRFARECHTAGRVRTRFFTAGSTDS